MKQCGWCLMLGRQRVFDIRQLREHFDTDIVAGYLTGGVLESWLLDAGETEILSRVKKIDRSGDVNAQLEFIFGVRPEKKPDVSSETEENVKKALKARSAVRTADGAAQGSFAAGSFTVGSFTAGSFTAGSFTAGSFTAGSFAVTSFSANSLSAGSFMAFGSGKFYTGGLGQLNRLSSWHFSQLSSWRYGTSFRAVNFGRSGSFRLSSGFMSGKRLFLSSGRAPGGSGLYRGSFRSGSGGYGFGGGSGGSFRYYAGKTEITEEEYHRTLINLSSCPLNEYGYGIHLV